MVKIKRLFQTISRLLLISFIVFTWFAPASPAYANTVSCVEDGTVLDCDIEVTDSDGVDISFTLTEDDTAISFTTFTSLTCDAHSNEASAADPYLYLLDASDNVIASDDDSASHNDGTNFCWDSYISIIDLAAGSYTLNLNVYENFYGVYSMDIAGIAELTTPTTTTTTTTSTTTTTTTEPPSETTTTTTTTTAPPPPPTTSTTTTTTTTTEPPLIIFDFEELPELPEQEFDLNEWLQEFESTEQEPEMEPDSDEPEPEPEPVQVFEETEFETETEETDLVDILSVEEFEEWVEELEVEEIQLLEELLDDPDIDVELVQELEEVLDEEITVEEIEALTDNEDFDELPKEALDEIVEAVNEAPEEIKEQFENSVDVFEDGYGDYVQTGSTIPVDDRKTLIVVSTVTAIGATLRPAATTSTTGPTSGPTRRRGRNG